MKSLKKFKKSKLNSKKIKKNFKGDRIISKNIKGGFLKNFFSSGKSSKQKEKDKAKSSRIHFSRNPKNVNTKLSQFLSLYETVLSHNSYIARIPVNIKLIKQEIQENLTQITELTKKINLTRYENRVLILLNFKNEILRKKQHLYFNYLKIFENKKTNNSVKYSIIKKLEENLEPLKENSNIITIQLNRVNKQENILRHQLNLNLQQGINKKLLQFSSV